jgi:hypothetical protein
VAAEALAAAAADTVVVDRLTVAVEVATVAVATHHEAVVTVVDTAVQEEDQHTARTRSDVQVLGKETPVWIIIRPGLSEGG